MNITHPCKQLVVDIVDELDPDAEHLRAVNLVVFERGRLIGYNTDWMGYRDGLIAGLPGASFERVVQIGCGGAGAATAYALLSCGTARLDLSDVDAARAEDLAERMRAALPDADGRDGADRGPLRRRSRARPASCMRRRWGCSTTRGSRSTSACSAEGAWVSDVVYRPLRDRAHPAGGRAGPSRCSTAAGWPSARHTLVFRSSRASSPIATGWSGTSGPSSTPRRSESGAGGGSSMTGRLSEAPDRQRDDRSCGADPGRHPGGRHRRVRGERLRGRAGRRDRRADANDEADDLLLLRLQGGPVPGGPGARVRADPPRRARHPDRRAVAGRGAAHDSPRRPTTTTRRTRRSSSSSASRTSIEPSTSVSPRRSCART